MSIIEPNQVSAGNYMLNETVQSGSLHCDTASTKFLLCKSLVEHWSIRHWHLLCAFIGQIIGSSRYHGYDAERSVIEIG